MRIFVNRLSLILLVLLIYFGFVSNSYSAVSCSASFPGWVQVLDDEEWISYMGESWDPESRVWISGVDGSNNLESAENSALESTDIRPSKIRVLWNESAETTMLGVYDTSESQLASINPYSSGEEASLVVGQKIGALNLGYNALTINNIELYFEQDPGFCGGDTTPPSVPQLNSFPGSIYQSSIRLSGIKDVDSSILINGLEVVALNSSSLWDAEILLQFGQNSIDITSRDLAGNESNPLSEEVEVLPYNQYDPDIVGLWRMDGNWQDSSGNEHHASGYNGASFIDDCQLGSSAASFDGTNDYAIVSGVDNFPTDEITVEYWVKSLDTDVNNRVPFSYAASGGSNNELTLFKTSDIYIWFAGVDYGRTGISVNDGQWHHVALTWRSYDGQIRVFKDGVNEFTGTVAKGDRLRSGGTIVFAQDQDSLGGGFQESQAHKGYVDDVAVYKRVLTDEEIQEKYSIGLHEDKVPPVAPTRV